MIQAGLVSKSSTPLVRVLRRTSAAGKLDAELFEDRNGFRSDGIMNYALLDYVIAAAPVKFGSDIIPIAKIKIVIV